MSSFRWERVRGASERWRCTVDGRGVGEVGAARTNENVTVFGAVGFDPNHPDVASGIRLLGEFPDGAAAERAVEQWWDERSTDDAQRALREHEGSVNGG